MGVREEKGVDTLRALSRLKHPVDYRTLSSIVGLNAGEMSDLCHAMKRRGWVVFVKNDKRCSTCGQRLPTAIDGWKITPAGRIRAKKRKGSVKDGWG